MSWIYLKVDAPRSPTPPPIIKYNYGKFYEDEKIASLTEKEISKWSLFLLVEAPRSPTPPPIIKYHYGKLKAGKNLKKII